MIYGLTHQALESDVWVSTQFHHMLVVSLGEVSLLYFYFLVYKVSMLTHLLVGFGEIIYVIG